MAKASNTPAKKVVFQRTNLFNDTFQKYAANATVTAKFEDFINFKRQDPLKPYGSKDEHFKGNGPLGQSKVIHVHLTHNVNLIYTRSGSNPMTITLIWIGVHDEMGTGQPPNAKLQKNAAAKFLSAKPDGAVFENGK